MAREGLQGEESSLALIGGTVIDGTGKDPLEDSVLIVRGRVIEAVGTRDVVKVGRDAATMDVSGKIVMPGMIDSHLHISLTSMSIERSLFTPKTVQMFQAVEMMKRTLQAGFTTVRDAGTLNDVGFRQAVEMGLVEGPRLVVAGPVVQTGGHLNLYFPSGVELPLFYGGDTCDGVDEVRLATRRLLRQGFDLIKVATSGGVGLPGDSPYHTEWALEELKAIVHEASARGKVVMAHAIGNQGVRNAVLGGVWSVEHGDHLDDETIQMLVNAGTFLVPTLLINEQMAEEGMQGPAPTSQDEVERLRRRKVDGFKEAAAAGVKIAVGTDALTEEMHGTNARELELMVRHGLSPMQAIVAATKTGSEVCRVDDRVGTLEVGKLADLLVVEGNPLNDVSILQDKTRLLLIMKEGRVHVNRMGD